MKNKVLRIEEVAKITTLSRSCIYLKINQGGFPPPRKMGGGRAICWLEKDIDDWLENLPVAEVSSNA